MMQSNLNILSVCLSSCVLRVPVLRDDRIF